eukprot:scaffold24467_cov108-Skeletonema_dohrnii-CCMP3373.AAC.3
MLSRSYSGVGCPPSSSNLQVDISSIKASDKTTWEGDDSSSRQQRVLATGYDSSGSDDDSSIRSGME